MQLSKSILRNVVSSALVAAALGFGASSAMAEVAQMACNDRYAWGTCYSPVGCANLCQTLGGPTWASACIAPCCYCFEG